MKNLIQFAAIVSLMFLSFNSQAQKSEKKTQHFVESKVLPFSADMVWQVVGVDYGAIAKSHPKIIKSEYINGTLKAGEGAERICYFNDKGTQFLKEKMVGYDPGNYTFRNTVSQTGKFPMDPELTVAVYKVTPIDEHSSRISFDMTYRTKPAMMGGMMKGKFKKLIRDYFVAIEHHLSTGDPVNKENFKDVKKLYATN